MKEPHRNPFLRSELVVGYESWYETEGREADRLEKALLGRFLGGFPGSQTILDVGCGTGHFTRWFREKGLKAVGVDASPAMLEEAGRLNSPSCVKGDALDLPFDDHSYDLVSIITALEFVASPGLALEEAVRVARQGLLLGALNRESELGQQLMQSGQDPWKAGHFFTVDELSALAKEAAGPRFESIDWRTTLLPDGMSAAPRPEGGFIGMAVHLVEPKGG